MNRKWIDRISSFIDFLERRRKLLWSAAAATAVYTLLGFFLAPWLVEKTFVDTLRERYDVELRLEKVQVNPYVLSLRITGFDLDDPSGEPTARADEIYVNFQLSSLFRWAWTFDEFRITAPELFVSRSSAGNLNLSYLFESDADETSVEEDASLPHRMKVTLSTKGTSKEEDEVARSDSSP